MTSEREAKVWMVVAGVMVVWACTMVGCTTSTAIGPATPLNRPTTSFVDPAWSSTPSITLSPDTSGQPADLEGELSLDGINSATVFAPSQPDVIVLQPRHATSPRFDVELSGLSIAQPLVSAKRLLVAAVTMLPPVTAPEGTQATSAVAHADLSDQPVAVTTGWTQGLAYEQPAAEAAAVNLGLAMLDRSSVMLPPWETDPTPTPTVAAALTTDEAKFDSAGVVALVLGAMVLFFGGEAVVLWMLDRRRQVVRVSETEVAEAEGSIFRFPESTKAEADKSYSRAA